jgi:hypothetical protein
MRMRNQLLVIEALDKAAVDLPFAMLGVDSDNDCCRRPKTEPLIEVVPIQN